MTEREKMLAGLVYNAAIDEELAGERAACKDQCHRFNGLMPSDALGQREMMERILGEIRGSFFITAPFWCDYGYNITIGDNFYTNHNCVILDCAKVTFGDNVFIGPNCGFYTAGHVLDPVQRGQGLEFARPITVGSDVWIGGGVQVMPGVTIGDGAVIGAGSVVTRDIPGGVIAVGNPCRVLRRITGEDKGN